MDFIRGQNTPYFLETLISKSDSGPVSYRVFRETGPWSLNLGPLSLIYCLLFLNASYSYMNLKTLKLDDVKRFFFQHCFDFNTEVLRHLEGFENFVELGSRSIVL